MPKYFPDESFVPTGATKFIAAMEAEATAHPDRFRTRLVLHIVLGYAAYLSAAFLAMLLSLLAVFAALASRAIWLVGAALGSFASGIALLQSLHVQLPAPRGIPIRREDAPVLYETVEQVIAKTSAPDVDAILLIPETNANIKTRYLNGLFGRTSTTLSLGLPLLQLLAPAEFQALLHHELAHSSGGHGHSAIWTGRVWDSWSQLPLMDEELGFAARLILPPIYRWFMPKLCAYHAVLSRIHEFEADRQALLAGTDSKPDCMLVRIALADQFMQQRFWPAIWSGTKTMPRTPSQVFSRLPEFAAEVSGVDVRAWLKLELNYKSKPLDSHPDIKTRLEAMGTAVNLDDWVRTIEECGFTPNLSAASFYLGNSLPSYERELTEKWARSCFLNWEDAFRQFDLTRKRLTELQELEAAGELRAEQRAERALCFWNLEGPAAAEPLLREAHAANPQNPEIAFNLGRCLLAQEKEEGMLMMDKVIGMAPSRIRLQGTTEICNYLERHDRHEEAMAFYNRMAREDDMQQKIAKERGNISPYDPVSSHGLEPGAIEQIRVKVSTLEWIQAAYFCRKPTPLSPDCPLYLLCIKPRKHFLIPAFRPGMTAFDQLAALNCYPWETRFLLLDGAYPTLEKKIKKLPDAQLFKY
jgi:Zn-dependent protease with chaperone function/tetratricopeptide (TPR) repeat protein